MDKPTEPEQTFELQTSTKRYTACASAVQFQQACYACLRCVVHAHLYIVVLGLSINVVCDIAGLLGCNSWTMMMSMIVTATGMQLALLLALAMDGNASR